MPGRRGVWWSALALLVTSCLLDDERCGKNQHEANVAYEAGCVCDEGAVPNSDGIGCHFCGDHERVVAGMCVCESGYARANASAECTPKDETSEADAGDDEPGTSGQDMSCSSAADCANFDATYCLTLQPPSACLVQGCATGERRCAADRECCVITVLPELAATGGLCLPQGKCAAPGMVVTP